RFERQSVYDQITILHQLDKIIFENFDIVISREVLEHVKYPQNVINRIWAYLRNGGLAIITESFGRVEPAFPTHLKSNQKFDGQTERLFVETGFRLLKTFPGRRPMVFQKVAKLDKSRFDTLAPPRQEQEYDIQKKIKKIGKRLLRMIRF
ncbi:MAG: methyltransferase domain-containing protein, partial [Chloroflexota bacterium]|nr:methyltransferase domain-containing protein [Chloroflexota bacterium]